MSATLIDQHRGARSVCGNAEIQIHISNVPGGDILPIISLHQWKSELGFYQGWKVDGPPNDFHSNFDPTEGTKWQPKRRRLTDAGVIYPLLTLSSSYKAEHLPYDFNSKGAVRIARVPCAPTVVLSQNSVRFLPVWKGVYVFTGGYNDAGWLLNSDYPKATPEPVAGLVVAPPCVEDRQEPQHRPSSIRPSSRDGTRETREYLGVWLQQLQIPPERYLLLGEEMPCAIRIDSTCEGV